MVNCAVYGCTNRTKRAPNDENFVTVGFFAIPKVVTGQCAKTAALSAARRAEWFRRIRRDDVDESSTHYRVCGVHFISGRPTYVMDDMNPDWAPSLKLGYGDRAADRTASDRRYKRAQARKSAQTARGQPLLLSGMDARKESTLISTEDLAPASPLLVEAAKPALEDCCCTSEDLAVEEDMPGENEETERSPDCGLGSEMYDCGQTTDITLQSMALLEDENRQLMSDLRDARAKLAAHCLDEDAFQENKDMVPFYTGLPNFAILLAVFQLIQRRVSHNDRNCLTKFQEMIVFLIRLRLNTPLQDLAYRFQVSQPTISRIVDRWLEAAFTSMAQLACTAHAWKFLPSQEAGHNWHLLRLRQHES
ncbi:uncharacterized protein LOC120838815 [Ixodes scapularis]|uniref:uncharacterized protein LOC120838815 n=1 Tax=Ixodes scapularis TaxID=6945 RepID=UPI001A9EF352|nr:uncharacterized protein LOC120838815 [Ixodes scapularis]